MRPALALLLALLVTAACAPAPRAARAAPPPPLCAPAAPARDCVQTGRASYYAPALAGRATASGELYRPAALTAAHPSFPFGARLAVFNLANQREVIVRVNDRGPYARGRVLDLSGAAARALGFTEAGETRVRIRYLGPA